MEQDAEESGSGTSPAFTEEWVGAREAGGSSLPYSAGISCGMGREGAGGGKRKMSLCVSVCARACVNVHVSVYLCGSVCLCVFVCVYSLSGWIDKVPALRSRRNHMFLSQIPRTP